MSSRKVKKAEIFENKFLNIVYEDGTLCQIDLERLFDIEFIKENENKEKTNKASTPLKALREMYQVCLVANVADMRPEFELIEKTLKALEIIKEKNVCVGNLLSYCFETNDTYEEYVKSFGYADNYWDLGKELLTQEEYELLKEVLNNGK